jgi:hypothetical protein
LTSPDVLVPFVFVLNSMAQYPRGGAPLPGAVRELAPIARCEASFEVTVTHAFFDGRRAWLGLQRLTSSRATAEAGP